MQTVRRVTFILRFLIGALFLSATLNITAGALPAASTPSRVLLAGSHLPHTAASLPVGVYQSRPHVATWNIYGANGNAYEGFNTNVTATDTTGTNTGTVQDRIRDRWPHLYAVGLQEVCAQNWNYIIYELAFYGLHTSTTGYQFYPQPNIGILVPNSNWWALYPACGAWSGNGIILKGHATDTYWTPFDVQPTAGITSHISCARNLATVCTAHPGPATMPYYPATQGAQYRDVATFISAASGLSLFATGDFNLHPGGFTTTAWAQNSFKDADDHGGALAHTTDYGTTLDYIFRTRPNSWAADGWVSPSAWSDHHWKQGYHQ